MFFQHISKIILLGLMGILAVGSTVTVAEVKLDPCSLLTREEVEAEFGGPVQKTNSGESQAGSKYCNWHGPAQSSLRKKGLLIDRRTRQRCITIRGIQGTMKNGKSEKGLGAAAYSTPEGVLVLYRDNVYLQISPLFGGKEHTLEMSKRLASKALERLR